MPGMYPGYAHQMFFTDYYAPGMSPEASYAGMQMPQMYSGAPTDKNFARPAAPAPGMAAGAEVSNAPAQTDKAPGMARENAMMYGQQGSMPFMYNYPSYPNNQGYMYGSYP